MQEDGKGGDEDKGGLGGGGGGTREVLRCVRGWRYGTECSKEEEEMKMKEERRRRESISLAFTCR